MDSITATKMRAKLKNINVDVMNWMEERQSAEEYNQAADLNVVYYMLDCVQDVLNGLIDSLIEQEEDTKEEITPVIFRAYVTKNKGVTVKREVIAIFPEQPGTNNPYTCGAYMHVGQHSSCDPISVIESTVPADVVERNLLRDELETIGYRLKVYQRYSKRMEIARTDKLLKG